MGITASSQSTISTPVVDEQLIPSLVSGFGGKEFFDLDIRAYVPNASTKMLIHPVLCICSDSSSLYDAYYLRLVDIYARGLCTDITRRRGDRTYYDIEKRKIIKEPTAKKRRFRDAEVFLVASSDEKFFVQVVSIVKEQLLTHDTSKVASHHVQIPSCIEQQSSTSCNTSQQCPSSCKTQQSTPSQQSSNGNTKQQGPSVCNPKESNPCLLNVVQPKTHDKRRTIPASIRDKVWRLHTGGSMDGTCFCCGVVIQRGLEGQVWDCGHILSHDHGGPVEVSNLRPVCIQCNRGGMRTMHLFEYIMMKDEEMHNPHRGPHTPVSNGDLDPHRGSRAPVENIHTLENREHYPGVYNLDPSTRELYLYIVRATREALQRVEYAYSNGKIQFNDYTFLKTGLDSYKTPPHERIIWIERARKLCE